MSSGFVSGGTADAPIERDAEWLAAQQELEENRRRKAEAARQTEGRSLFEVLEANKAAKEEAFIEANKLSHQFRSLDEDEIDFLDSVLESTRAEEDRVKKETAEGLEVFRKQQEALDKKTKGQSDALEGDAVDDGEVWTSGTARKRKRTKEKEGLKGVKPRKASSTSEQQPNVPVSQQSVFSKASWDVTSPAKTSISPVLAFPSTKGSDSPSTAVPAKSSLRAGLVAYGSDSDDE